MIPFLGDLKNLFFQDDWDEIYINGTHALGILKGQNQIVQKSPFDNQKAMIREVQEFALSMNLRLDPYQPEAGGMIPDKPVRWHAIIPPAAPEGPLLSFRLHRMQSITPESFADPNRYMNQIDSVFQEGLPLVICGETGSGKSTLLHALMSQYSLNKRVLIFEETNELPLTGPLWGKLLSKGNDLSGSGSVTFEQLFRMAMRLRPDQLVFGELKGQEAAIFCQGVLSGHQSGMATLHATDIEDMKLRFPCIRDLMSVKRICIIELGRGSPPGIRKLSC